VSGLSPLDRFNQLSDEEAAAQLLAVCHSRRWAKEVAADEHRRITRLRLERLMQR
jgi:hypothetical protein